MDIGAGGTRSDSSQARPQGSSPQSASTTRATPLSAPLAIPQRALPQSALPLLPLQQFFATAPVPCPYIPGRAERKLVVELTGRGAPIFYDELSRAGFRRSHRFAYRPACRLCSACVPVRIAVERFADTRSTRRVRNLNREFSGRLVPARANLEQFRLFAAYQHSRHRDSDMALMSYGDFRSMVEDTTVRTG